MKGHVLQSQFYAFIYTGKNQSAVYFVFSFMNKRQCLLNMCNLYVLQVYNTIH